MARSSIHEIGQRQVVEIKNHLLRESKAQRSLHRRPLWLAAEIVQLRGIGIEMVTASAKDELAMENDETIMKRIFLEAH